jgi:hypothetical protein
MVLRLTYDATLAELTSLEEMLRSMMDDGQIHSDVVSKLWQVYSQSALSFGVSILELRASRRLRQTVTKTPTERCHHHTRNARPGKEERRHGSR